MIENIRQIRIAGYKPDNGKQTQSDRPVRVCNHPEDRWRQVHPQVSHAGDGIDLPRGIVQVVLPWLRIKRYQSDEAGRHCRQ